MCGGLGSLQPDECYVHYVVLFNSALDCIELITMPMSLTRNPDLELNGPMLEPAERGKQILR